MATKNVADMLDGALGDALTSKREEAPPQEQGAAASFGDFAGGNVTVGDWTLGKELGKGTFSKVFEGVHKNGKHCAIKVFERSVFADMRRLELLKREIDIMRQMEHPNVVQLRGMVQSKKHVCLVLQLVDGYTLGDVIQNQRCTEKEARWYFQQIVAGVQHIHSKGIAHRDLKPENVLIERATNRVLLTDFGLSKPQAISVAQQQSICGTPYFLAPEVVFEQVYNGKKVDMWALGVLLYNMVTGHKPFDGRHLPELFQNIHSGKFDMPKNFSPELQDLIRKLLMVKPASRATVYDVVNHPWFIEDLRENAVVVDQTTRPTTQEIEGEPDTKAE